MNIAVRYQSRGGNTRAVAEIIAHTLGVKAEPIESPLDEKVGLLFLGGGVYGWDVDKKLLDYLGCLDTGKVGQIAAFSTTGAMTTATNRIVEYAKKAGINVNDNQLCLKLLLRGHATFGLRGGKLKGTQIEKIRKFALAARDSYKNP